MTVSELQLRLQALVRTCPDKELLERAIRMFEASYASETGRGGNSVSLEAMAKAREEFYQRVRKAQ